MLKKLLFLHLTLLSKLWTLHNQLYSTNKITANLNTRIRNFIIFWQDAKWSW